MILKFTKFIFIVSLSFLFFSCGSKSSSVTTGTELNQHTIFSKQCNHSALRIYGQKTHVLRGSNIPSHINPGAKVTIRGTAANGQPCYSGQQVSFSCLAQASAVSSIQTGVSHRFLCSSGIIGPGTYYQTNTVQPHLTTTTPYLTTSVQPHFTASASLQIGGHYSGTSHLAPGRITSGEINVFANGKAYGLVEFSNPLNRLCTVVFDVDCL